MARFNETRPGETPGTIKYMDERGTHCSARLDLLLIREVWYSTVRGSNVPTPAARSIEKLADGFGPGLGTMGGDWSGVRDSSPDAIAKMTEVALNHLLGDRR